MADDEKNKPEGPDNENTGQDKNSSGEEKDSNPPAPGGNESEETPKKTAAEMRSDITDSLGNFFNKDNNPAWKWFGGLTEELRDKLPENALSQVQETFTDAGKKLDAIDPDASLAQKAKQGFDILQSTAKSLAGLAEKNLGKSEEKGKDGEETNRSGVGVNSTLLAASAIALFAGQKMASNKSNDGLEAQEEASGAKKVFGRVIQVVAAAVAALGIAGLVKGKSGIQIADWRNKVSNEPKGHGQVQG